MRKKMKKQGGFTLVEMLIVVAIIAILIAVSIPLVSSALEEARKATDAANERSFKAALVTGYLLKDANMIGTGSEEVIVDTPYAFDAVNGVVKKDLTSNNKYGKSGNAKEKFLCGYIKSSGEVVMKWSTSVPSNAAGVDAVTDGELVSPGLVSPTA